MAYGDFTLDLLVERFGIKNREESLFDKVKPIQPSSKLQDALQFAGELPVRTEKAKSEWIVAPILAELRQRNNGFFTIYSGENLNVDEASGLKGECDFILAKDVSSFGIDYPIFQLVEAKKHDIEFGVPQCAAQMLGAKIFNEKRDVHLEKIYGCVTNGNEWLFLCLENYLRVHNKTYFLNEIEQILAVFQEIIDYYKQQLS